MSNSAYVLAPAYVLRLYELSTIKPGLAIAYLSQIVGDSGINSDAAAWLNAVAKNQFERRGNR